MVANFILLKVFDLEHVLQSYTSLVFIYKLHTMSVKLLTVIMYLMTCINGSNGNNKGAACTVKYHE